LEIQDPKLIDFVSTKIPDDQIDKEGARPNSVKLCNFVYAGENPTYYASFPYRDITQTKLINFSVQDVKKLWVDFTRFCKAYPHVYCMDLKNEPHSGATSTLEKSTGRNPTTWQGVMSQVHGAEFEGPNKGIRWETWNTFNNEVGKAVLAENPNICIAVEGLDDTPDSAPGAGDGVSCWGGSFAKMKDSPVPLEIPRNRLILSPHVYGLLAGRHMNGPKQWEQLFGFLANDYNIAVGEWSQTKIYDVDKKHTEAEDTYINALVAYMRTIEADAYQFAVNYTSGDTIALLKYDAGAKTVSVNKPMEDLMKAAAHPTKVSKFNFTTKTKFPA
jgi:aryl-phospho-beta-D-glucosidase BglC (GH1 family)